MNALSYLDLPLFPPKKGLHPEPVPQSQNMGTDFYSEKCDYLPEHSSLSRIQQLVEEIMSKD